MTSLRLFPILVLACAAPKEASPVPPAPPPAPSTPTAPTSIQPARPAGPPAAKVDVVVETLHGVTVRDPYRWMEAGGPALEQFLDAQDAYARTTLAAIPGRAQFRAALREANHSVTTVDMVGVTGSRRTPRVFLLKRGPDDDSAQLYVRDGWTGTDRLVVDPRARNANGVHHTIDYARPSPDGKHVVYGISASGSEDSVIEILDVDRGVALREKIDRAQYAGVVWRDNTSFFYWRRRAPAPGDTRADWFKHSASHLHVLGGDPEREAPVFSPLMPGINVDPGSFSQVVPSLRSPWAIVGASPGTSADHEYFVAPLAKVAPGTTPWRRLSGPTDHVKGMVAHSNTLYALSYAGAPRQRVLAINAASGTLASAKVFVAESSAVIESMFAAEDALYLLLFDRGQSRVQRVSYDGKQRREIELPFSGSAGIWGESDRPGIFISLEGWTQQSTDFHFDPVTGLRDLALHEPWPKDYSHVTSELVESTSKDGTKVPMAIVRRKDTPLDGTAPAVVSGYQAYGVTDGPSFRPSTLTWIDFGGVRAQCYGRGTGNLGKQWHLDGVKHNKERGVEDFIACAEYLVDHKYTSASRLTTMGTSAGGILAGGAVTRRPDLYAAAILRVPVVNLLRVETTEGGPANVPEYGALGNAADFPHMLASDPYHRVVEGTRYPALLITGGKHDVRVPVWIPAKFTARVQAANKGDRPILLRVESEAGHGIGSTQSQLDDEWADIFAFARWQSGVPMPATAQH